MKPSRRCCIVSKTTPGSFNDVHRNQYFGQELLVRTCGHESDEEKKQEREIWTLTNANSASNRSVDELLHQRLTRKLWRLKRVIGFCRRCRQVLSSEHLSVSFQSVKTVIELAYMPSWNIVQLLQIGSLDVKSRAVDFDTKE